MTHTTHSACMTRIEKEGGKAHCCVCEPHEGCTLGMKKNTPTATVVMERVNCKGVGDNDGFWKATITKNTPKDSFSDFVRSDSPEKAKVMDEILEKSIKRQNDSVKDTPKETWAKDNNCFEFKTIEDRDMFGVWIAKELTQAKAEGAREVIGEIQYRLDGAKQDVEMAEDPADPKVRINYFESVLATLREENVKS